MFNIDSKCSVVNLVGGGAGSLAGKTSGRYSDDNGSIPSLGPFFSHVKVMLGAYVICIP